MESTVIETKIVVKRLNRLNAAEDRIGEMEGKPKEILHRDKKVKDMS